MGEKGGVELLEVFEMFGKNRLQYIDIKSLVVVDCNVSKPYH
jgi:hypothetical protein